MCVSVCVYMLTNYIVMETESIGQLHYKTSKAFRQSRRVRDLGSGFLGLDFIKFDISCDACMQTYKHTYIRTNRHAYTLANVPLGCIHVVRMTVACDDIYSD